MRILNKMNALMMGVLFTSPAFAAGGLKDVVGRITENVGAFTNLLAIILILVGMYCIYQLVMTFTNRDEGNRDYPMKNVPYYFIGAALGIGAMAMNGVVLETLFGSSGDHSGGDSDFWDPDR